VGVNALPALRSGELREIELRDAGVLGDLDTPEDYAAYRSATTLPPRG
jgi:hypothetical protein